MKQYNIPTKELHRNIPQLLLETVFARIMLLIWGRGTGKSFGGIAPLISRCAMEMPRSVGAVGCDSYRHLIGDLLPEYIKSWEALGLKENIHYWDRKNPPANRKIPKAYRPVLIPKDAIFWGNGSATKLFSMNFNALTVGNSIDYLFLDEVKDVKEDRAKKTILTVRGNDEYFKGKSCHGMIVFATDMPDNPDAFWIFEYENLVDDSIIEQIILIEKQINDIRLQLLGDISLRKQGYLEGQLKEWGEIINELRKETAFVSLASTLDNLHAIGFDKVKTFQQTLTKLEFSLSVMNERLTKLDKCFYPDIRENEHSYSADNNAFIYTLEKGQKQDCRWDTDVNKYEPLDVGFDANGALCYLAVGQIQGNEGKFLNEIYVEYPLKIGDAFQKFCDYYGYPYQINRNVNLFFDSTMIGEDANRTQAETFKQVAINTLEKNGFVVNLIDMGVPLNHKTRYNEFGNILNNKCEIVFRYNKYNCKHWKKAADNTTWKLRVTQSGKTFEKNKLPEKSKIPPLQAQHPTDAVDSLVMGWLFFKENSNSFIGSPSY